MSAVRGTVGRAALVAVALLLAGCGQGAAGGARGGGASPPASSEDAARVVTEAARLELPDSVDGLRVHEESGLDRVVYAEFQMDPAEVDAFLAAAGAEDAREGRRVLGGGSGPFTDWEEDLDAATSLLGASTSDGSWGRKL